MELNLKGKRVLVTGASKGIGRACVEMLEAEGCKVLGVSRSIAPGPNNKAVDLALRGAAEEVAAWAGDLDILVNNAGAIPGGDLLKDAIDHRCDLLVTGDVRYHSFLEARDSGLIIVDAGHAPTEWPGVVALFERLMPRSEGRRGTLISFTTVITDGNGASMTS